MLELGSHSHPNLLIKLSAGRALGCQDRELGTEEHWLVLFDQALVLIAQAQLAIEDHDHDFFGRLIVR